MVQMLMLFIGLQASYWEVARWVASSMCSLSSSMMADSFLHTGIVGCFPVKHDALHSRLRARLGDNSVDYVSSSDEENVLSGEN